MEGRHGFRPFLGFQKLEEGTLDHPCILADVERGKVQAKHPDLEDELSDLVHIQPIEILFHLLFQTAKAMPKDILLQRQVTRVEDGVFDHALQHVQFAFEALEGDQTTQLSEFLLVAAQQGQLELSRHAQGGLCPNVGVAVAVAAWPKPNAQHAHVESLPIGSAQGICHPGPQGGTGLEKDVLQVPNLTDGLFVRRGRFALEKRGQPQLMKSLSDAHQVVVLHRQGQVRDDGQNVPRIKLRGVRGQHDTHGVGGQHRPHVLLKAVATHALHEALERLRPAHVVELGVPGVFQGIDQDDLTLDVLDDAEQQRRPLLGIGLALSRKEGRQDVMGGIAALQSQLASLLQERDAQARLSDSVQGQREENPIEHLVGMAHHRPIILLFSHDGSKVTSYF